MSPRDGDGDGGNGFISAPESPQQLAMSASTTPTSSRSPSRSPSSSPRQPANGRFAPASAPVSDTESESVTAAPASVAGSAKSRSLEDELPLEVSSPTTTLKFHQAFAAFPRSSAASNKHRGGPSSSSVGSSSSSAGGSDDGRPLLDDEDEDDDEFSLPGLGIDGASPFEERSFGALQMALSSSSSSNHRDRDRSRDRDNKMNGGDYQPMASTSRAPFSLSASSSFDHDKTILVRARSRRGTDASVATTASARSSSRPGSAAGHYYNERERSLQSASTSNSSSSASLTNHRARPSDADNEGVWVEEPDTLDELDEVWEKLGMDTDTPGLGLGGSSSLPRSNGSARLGGSRSRPSSIGAAPPPRAPSPSDPLANSVGSVSSTATTADSPSASSATSSSSNMRTFLLSPPPPPPGRERERERDGGISLASSRQATTASIENAKKEKGSSGAGGGGRERTFPAPLLLKSDRVPPFTRKGSFASVTAPLALGGAKRQHSTSPAAHAHASGGDSISSSTGGPFGSPSPSGSSQLSSSATSNTSGKSAVDGLIGRDRQEKKQHFHSPSSSLSQLLASANQALGYAAGVGGGMGYNHSPSQSISSVSTSNAAGGAAFSPSLGSSSSSVFPSSASSSHSHHGFDTPITPQALLLYVLSLRSAASAPMTLSQSHGPRSAAPTTASFAAASAAAGGFNGSASHSRIKSSSAAEPDDEPGGVPPSAGSGKLDLVDLSHKKIAEIPQDVVEELRDEAEKLALGYNLLRDLPSHFTLLGNKLRYLSVRVNLLTAVPAVLCDMPSLEILDISRNKIRKLPHNPGTLLNLKVFSIAKNKVRRLPIWFGKMSQLRILKLEQNPIDWPPKEVVTFGPLAGSHEDVRNANGTRTDDSEEMHRWIAALTGWIRDNGEPNYYSTSLPDLPDVPSDEERGGVIVKDFATLPRSEVSPALSSASTFSSTSRSTAFGGGQSRHLYDDLPQRHSRNASHSTSQAAQPKRRNELKSKKSLPDLRQNHAEILADRLATTSEAGEYADIGSLPAPSTSPAVPEKTPSPLGPKDPALAASAPAKSSTPPVVPGANNLSISIAPASMATPPPKSPIAKVLATAKNMVPSSSALGDTSFIPNPLKRTAQDPSSGAFDRSSGAYFRRLSMLPPSTISKTIPVTLLEFADAIRGILFSLSQIYAALRQFMVFASQDRLPTALARLMNDADESMSILINALDRFDSLSRRGTPEASVVQDIFSTCRKCVSVFAKLTATLGTHLSTLTAASDIRYTRTLLLMLYGSMGEIVNSWKAVAPMLQEMSQLNEDSSLATLILHPPTPSPTLPGQPQPIVNGSPGLNMLVRSRSKSRRHAGSFSVEDVQTGAHLPPATRGGPGGTRAAEAPLSESPTSLPILHAPSPMPFMPTPFQIPLPSPTAILTSSTASSPVDRRPRILATQSESVLTARQPSLASSAPVSASHGQLMSQAATPSADKVFLELTEATATVAVSVYKMLLDGINRSRTVVDQSDLDAITLQQLGPKKTKELLDLCLNGNESTTRMKKSLDRVRSAERRGLEVSSSDARRLGDDSYAFVRSVISFAKLVKWISAEYGFSQKVREGVGQLTISTREFARHLTHSSTSFRPSSPYRKP